MNAYEYDLMVQEEEGSKLGDPRRCPRHPHVMTSSRDGMHDAPCGECEYEMDLADEYLADQMDVES